jgi:hypothetical protein
VLAVMLGVMTAGLDMMMFGMAGMTVGTLGVVRRLLVIAGLMMPGGFAMVLGCVLVVFGRLVMMVNACVVAHVFSPGWPMSKRDAGLRKSPDNVLTASRQDCCGRPVVKPPRGGRAVTKSSSRGRPLGAFGPKIRE